LAPFPLGLAQASLTGGLNAIGGFWRIVAQRYLIASLASGSVKR
jgi:hypothetical protein